MKVSIRLSTSFVGQAEADAVAKVITESGFMGMGEQVHLFEAELAHYLGVEAWQVVVVNSGTAALHLALEALHLQYNVHANAHCFDDQKRPTYGEVLVPSLTFVASVQAISAANYTPIFYDIHEGSACIDVRAAEEAITERTFAIMPVYYASNPWMLDDLYTLAQKYSLHIIEDAAHAFGCKYKDKLLGSIFPLTTDSHSNLGHVTCFSFDGIKNITSGEGGAIVCKDAQLATLCRQGRMLGIHHDSIKNIQDVAHQGWRYHMSDLCAALGRVQLERLDREFAPQRQELYGLYKKLLWPLVAKGKLMFLEQDPHAFVIPHICSIRILHGQRDAVKEYLQAKGIEVRIHYTPVHTFKYYNSRKYSLPITEKLHTQLLTLPLHAKLSVDDVRLVCASIMEVVQ